MELGTQRPQTGVGQYCASFKVVFAVHREGINREKKIVDIGIDDPNHGVCDKRRPGGRSSRSTRLSQGRTYRRNDTVQTWNDSSPLEVSSRGVVGGSRTRHARSGAWRKVQRYAHVRRGLARLGVDHTSPDGILPPPVHFDIDAVQFTARWNVDNPGLLDFGNSRKKHERIYLLTAIGGSRGIQDACSGLRSARKISSSDEVAPWCHEVETVISAIVRSRERYCTQTPLSVGVISKLRQLDGSIGGRQSVGVSNPASQGACRCQPNHEAIRGLSCDHMDWCSLAGKNLLAVLLKGIPVGLNRHPVIAGIDVFERKSSLAIRGNRWDWQNGGDASTVRRRCGSAGQGDASAHNG